MSGDLNSAPLAGIRMLDFGHIVAGPFCARLLADLGVDLVKVETATREGRTGARRNRGGGASKGVVLPAIERRRDRLGLNRSRAREPQFANALQKVGVEIERGKWHTSILPCRQYFQPLNASSRRRCN